MQELGVRCPVRMIDAHGGKKVRAEPVALLWETGRAHMVGVHDMLEEQLVQFTGTGSKSPDRLDAMCHAVRELMGYRGGPTSVTVHRYRDMSASEARALGVHRWNNAAADGDYSRALDGWLR